MIYFLYYVLISIAYFLTKRYSKNSKKGLRAFAVVSAALLVLIVALRHPSMGNDLGYGHSMGYLGSYSTIGKMSWAQIFSQRVYMNYEFGYILLNKLLFFFSADYELLLIFCAVLSLVPYFVLYYRTSENMYFSVIVFLFLPLFLLPYSGLRQAIALAICCFACKQLSDRRPVPFLLLVSFAAFFHMSALIFVVAYPVYGLRIEKKIRYFLPAAALAVYVLRAPVFRLIVQLLGRNFKVDNNEAYLYFVFLLLIYVFLSLFAGEEDAGWLNVFLLACFVQAFAGLNSLVLRAGYFFLLPLPFLFPNALKRIPDARVRQVATLLSWLFFVGYGFYSIINSSWAKAYPYHFFWQQF